jgi:aminopeptidase N
MQTYDGDLIATADLRVVANKVFGENMDWFFDQYIEGMGIPEVAYKFNDATPAEDGKGWIITGKLSQHIMVKGDAVPGKVFKHLLVPITVPTGELAPAFIA